ncbi:hypothetical protein [Anaerolentibacter hominis]|uniref:hypothetical protein n=1 Tax=Anaerolentibacter hominis TaxID=3079009 RepID=UPI0031B815E9
MAAGTAAVFWPGLNLMLKLVVIFELFLLRDMLMENQLKNIERSVLKQLKEYIIKVRYCCNQPGQIEDILLDAAQELPGEISPHIRLLLEHLWSKDVPEQYFRKAIVPELTALFGLCRVTISFGTETNGGFQEQLIQLENEIQERLLFMEEIHHRFSGLRAMILVPGFCLPFIKAWGIANLPELGSYYDGSYGVAAVGLFMLFSGAAYELIRVMGREHRFLVPITETPLERRMAGQDLFRAGGDCYSRRFPAYAVWIQQRLDEENSHMTLYQFLVRRLLAFAAGCVLGTLFLGLMVQAGRNSAIHNTSSFTGTAFTSSQKELEEQRTWIGETAQRWKNEEKLPEEQLRSELNDRVRPSETELLIKEVKARIQQYKNCRFRWFYPILIGLTGYIAGLLPVVSLCLSILRKQEKEAEDLFRLQLIMADLIPIQDLDIFRLLEQMEQYAGTYARSLGLCLDIYDQGPEQALLQLEAEEKDPYFKDLVQSLLAADRIGISKAFSDLEYKKKQFASARGQKRKIRLSNQGILGRFAGYVPLLWSLGVYLIIPFVLEGLTQLKGFF